MDSAGLAQAVTNYWSETYLDHHQNESGENLLPIISIARVHRRIKKAISRRSATSSLLKFEWNWKDVKRGIYKDGHARGDMKEYCSTIYLPRMQSLQSQMMEWNANLKIIDKSYPPNSHPIVFITHDECTFNSNDGRKKIWIHANRAPIRKKARGQGLCVSDFLTPVGRLVGGNIGEVLKCGGDIWWTGDLLLEQPKEKASPAFETAYPGCQGLWAFDNAKIHQK